MDNILNEIVNDVKALYGENLKKIILYGSCARGQNNDESDIDLALIDANETEIKYYSKKLNDIISYIGTDIKRLFL